MEQFVTGYQVITTAGVGVIKQLGFLSLPLGVAIAVLVNFFGGERAIRAVGIILGTLVVLTLVLNNATSIGGWIQQPTAVAGAAAAATPVPGR